MSKPRNIQLRVVSFNVSTGHGIAMGTSGSDEHFEFAFHHEQGCFLVSRQTADSPTGWEVQFAIEDGMPKFFSFHPEVDEFLYAEVQANKVLHWNLYVVYELAKDGHLVGYGLKKHQKGLETAAVSPRRYRDDTHVMHGAHARLDHEALHEDRARRVSPEERPPFVPVFAALEAARPTKPQKRQSHTPFDTVPASLMG
jgi:hypothetical protein